MPDSQLSPTLSSTAWPAFAERAGIHPGDKLLLALSGGADSVFLLHLIARAEPRPALRVLHVQHGLRGAASEADEHFCAGLCASLGVPFARAEVRLDPHQGSLENQARQARYAALRREAEASAHHTILTGHQAEDVQETLLWRWIRGSAPQGLRGPRRHLALTPGPGGQALSVRRPILDLGRREIRAALTEAGLAWREDDSNLDPRFTRNRLRHGLMPLLEQSAGQTWTRDLARYARSIERLEQDLEARVAHLGWSRDPGGSMRLERAPLANLGPELRKRALWRLLSEGTGQGPRGVLLEQLTRDLQTKKNTKHTLGGGWHLSMGIDFLELQRPKPRPGR